jgi:8-oxo-dGTP diphosphatase
MNPFESGARKVVPAVLIYARNRDRVLMIHRNALGRPGDYHAGKWNGLGGKAEPDESPLETARRELLEESGLELPPERFRPLGVVQFPNFKAHKGEDWVVFVFAADVNDAESSHAWARSEEGDLHWVPASDLLSLSLWAGDRHFLPLVIQGRPFFGTIWYQGQDVTRHWIQPL